MTNAREVMRQRAEAQKRKQYEKMPSGIGERYEHPVHGLGTIIEHRPVVDRGASLGPPYIEVLLEFKGFEFWTGTCYLDTMEYIPK